MKTASLLCSLLAFSALAAPPEGRLTLEEAFRSAEAKNEAVQIAAQGVAQARVNSFQTWTAIAPNARIDVSGTAQSPATATGLPQPSALAQVSPQVTIPMYRKGFFLGTEAAAVGIHSADALVVRSREQLMLDVTNAFIGVLRARQQREVAQAAVDRAQAQEKSVAARVAAGGALRTSQLQSAIDRRRAEFQLITADRSVDDGEAFFLRVVRLPAPKELVLPPTPAVPTMDQALAATDQRSDVISAADRVSASRLTELSLAGLYWPRLDASLRYDYIDVPGPNPTIGAVRALATLSIPLFEASSWVANRNQRVQTQTAIFQESQLRNQAAEDVRHAVIQYQSAERSMQLAEEQRKDAIENYNLVSTQFKLRAVSFIEVIQAQASLTEAENQILVSKYDREIAAYQLLFASGQLAGTLGAR